VKCPYCDKELRAGFLHAARGAVWSEKESKATAFKTKGEVRVGDFWGLSPAYAFLCENCRTIIIKY